MGHFTWNFSSLRIATITNKSYFSNYQLNFNTMKRLFTILMSLLCIAPFTACDDDDDSNANGKRNDNAKIYIWGKDLNKNKAVFTRTEQTLSAHDILTGDSVVMYLRDEDLHSSCMALFCFADNNIDTINDRLIMEAGNLQTLYDNQFLTFKKALICKSANSGTDTGDTLGYIPYSQRQEAFAKIEPLWESESWNEMYEIFENAFSFYPCTAEEAQNKIEQNNL